MSDSFNTTQDLSWALSWKDQSHGCQSHIFQVGDSFRTNISAFTYSIDNVMLPSVSAKDSYGAQGSFAYSSNSLAECDVTAIELVVLPGDRSVEANVAITCSSLGFEAGTSWTYTNWRPFGTLSPSTFPEHSLARVILDVLHGFGRDAYKPIYHQRYVSRNSDPPGQLYKVTALFVPSCPTCDSETPNIPITWYNAIALSDLSLVADLVNYQKIVEAEPLTLQNLGQVLYAAVRLDLGHWTPNNILTNKSALNAAVIPGREYANETIASDKAPAYTNLTSPPSADVSTPPAVAQMQYACTVKQMKGGGSMFMSVSSATLSMFLSAWGALTAILASVARGRAGANTCTACGELDTSVDNLKRKSSINSCNSDVTSTDSIPLVLSSRKPS